MPIYWTIDSKQQLVVVTAEGDITRADADDYLDTVEGGGALAIVLADDVAELARRMLGILATADRPLKLFTSLTPAQRWIDSLAPAQ